MECFLLLLLMLFSFNTIIICTAGGEVHDGINKLIVFHRQRQTNNVNTFMDDKERSGEPRLRSQQQQQEEDRKEQNQKPIITGLDDYVPLFQKAKKVTNNTKMHYEFSFTEHGRFQFYFINIVVELNINDPCIMYLSCQVRYINFHKINQSTPKFAYQQRHPFSIRSPSHVILECSKWTTYSYLEGSRLAAVFVFGNPKELWSRVKIHQSSVSLYKAHNFSKT
jgi:hypothetical protein